MPDFVEITAELSRMPSPSLFGADIQQLSFHAEMQTSNRLRFKVTKVRQQLILPLSHQHSSLFTFQTLIIYKKRGEIFYNIFKSLCVNIKLDNIGRKQMCVVQTWKTQQMHECLIIFFQIFDAQQKRFEVPHEHINTVTSNPSTPISDALEITNEPFGLIVRRKENKKVLWVITQPFWLWSFK